MVFPKRKNLIIAAALLIAALVCLFVASRLSRPMQSQFQAERWAGESREEFRQFSVFLSPTDSMNTAQIMEFRYKLLDKLKAASVETPAGGRAFCDCWSVRDSTKIRSERGSFDAAVMAVGGDWFAFHPMTLRSGGFLAESDLMRDRVVLDEQLAWLLFGSADVTGMSVFVNGAEYLVAGVVADEDGRALRAVSEHKPTLYICFDAWEAGHEELSLSCYEIVLPEPVEGFGYTLLKDAFPLGGGALRMNSGRFGFSAFWKQLRGFAGRSVRAEAVAYPDWENAALWTESWCTLLRALALALLVFPMVLCAVILVRALRFGRGKAREGAHRLREKLLDRFEK